MDPLSIFFIAFFALSLLIVFVGMKIDEKAPVRRARAEVISKHSRLRRSALWTAWKRQGETIAQHWKRVEKLEEGNRMYLVTFAAPERRKRLVLEVSAQEFCQLEKGWQGELTYKGKRLLDFERHD